MRYTRQQILKEIGKSGQERLEKSSAAIVGLGALGSVSSELLARAGIGKILLIDRDVVELSNLQRQGIFEESDIGKPKASAAWQHLKRINSEITIEFFIEDLTCENISKIFSKRKNFDVILDCTDNLETRFLLNDFCVKNKVPFIYSAAVGTRGYVFNVMPGSSACLRCFLKEPAQLETCENTGVLNSITHLVSSVQANEAFKIILGRNYEKSLLFFDIWKNEFSKINANKNRNCICCAKNNFKYLDGKQSAGIAKLCGNNMYQIKAKPMGKKQFNILKNKLKKIGKVIDFSYCINFDGKITVFEDGRALLKAKDEKEAKSVYSKFAGN